LEKNCKNFHFQELNWLICFPIKGNEGRKYLHYSVGFTNSKENNSSEQVYLSEIIENPLFEDCFPHTVGFFKGSKEKSNLGYSYLEIRTIRSIEDFWKFLNDLDV